MNGYGFGWVSVCKPFQDFTITTLFQTNSDPQGNRAFVQMPLLTRGEEWLKSDECSSEVTIHVFFH